MNSYSLMNNIRMLQFAAIELNLYLDNFPENKEATKKYKEMRKNKKFTDKTLKRQKVFTNTMNCGKI